MDISLRPLRANDVEAAFHSVGYPFSFSPAVRTCVPEVWRQWLERGSLYGTLFLDLARPKPEIVGLAAIAFLSDDAYRAITEAPMPYTREWLVREELEGRSPLLEREAILAENSADGLHLIHLNDALGGLELSDEELIEIDEAYYRALQGLEACYLRSVLWEGYGAKRARLGVSCGFTLIADFPEVDAPEEQRPMLFGATREQAIANRGTHAAGSFRLRRPRLGLSTEHQEMLVLALDGQTDAELAESLCLSLSAIKKRWLAIYARVEQVAPGLLPAPQIESENARGAERRRRLLKYLRGHLHEFSPLQALRLT